MLLSPSRGEVSCQAAVESTPVIREPESARYKWPMAVLDFRSMYPSIISSDNLCYSTCLGLVHDRDRPQNLGVTDYHPPPGLLAVLRAEDAVTLSPNKLVFVKASARKGLLGRILNELTQGRELIKASIKAREGNPGFVRLQNTRQAALKFVTSVSHRLGHPFKQPN